MSDSQPPKKRYNLRKRRGKKNYKVKDHPDSDDSDSDYDPEEEEEVIMSDFSEEGEQEFKLRQFQKFVSLGRSPNQKWEKMTENPGEKELGRRRKRGNGENKM